MTHFIGIPRATRTGLIFTGLLGVLLGHSATAHADTKIALKAGDRVVFLGDSITQAGAGPGGYVTLVRESLAAIPEAPKVEILGAGISGNRVPNLEERLERDVLAKKPTLVVIYIGINDVWHSLQGRGTSKDDFRQGLERIIGRIHDAGARVILCTPSVIGEKTDGKNPLDTPLDEYADISRDVARQTKTALLDLRKQFLEHLKEKNADQAEKGILTTDGVHLNPAGNRFVADQMLTALGVTMRSDRVLRHVVLFQFKSSVTKEQVDEVVTAFAGLREKIELISDFEWGTDISVENKADGFTHGFVVSFRSTADRDAYLPHPAHQEFVKLVGPRIEKVLVFDFWSQSKAP